MCRSASTSPAGGLHSGVVSVASQLVHGGEDTHTGGKFFTFSALFPETIDETRYITEVGALCPVDTGLLLPQPGREFAEIMPWVYTQEGPTISSAPHAYYSVFREAAKHVRSVSQAAAATRRSPATCPTSAPSVERGRHQAYGRMIAEGVRGAGVLQAVRAAARAGRQGQGVTMTPFPESLKGFATSPSAAAPTSTSGSART